MPNLLPMNFTKVCKEETLQAELKDLEQRIGDAIGITER
jgi:hypothetical protein